GFGKEDPPRIAGLPLAKSVPDSGGRKRQSAHRLGQPRRQHVVQQPIPERRAHGGRVQDGAANGASRHWDGWLLKGRAHYFSLWVSPPLGFPPLGFPPLGFPFRQTRNKRLTPDDTACRRSSRRAEATSTIQFSMIARLTPSYGLWPCQDRFERRNAINVPASGGTSAIMSSISPGPRSNRNRPPASAQSLFR